jgi:hypothetical protein
MRARAFAPALLAVLAVASLALGQDAKSLPETLLARFGQTVDLTNDADLKTQLYDKGLITKTAKKVMIDRPFIEHAVGTEAYFNEVRTIRYHVGDRIFVKDATGEISARAEIAAILPNGRYTVNVWDRFTGNEVEAPTLAGPVDPVTGLAPAGSTPAKLAIEKPNGKTGIVSDPAPWLRRVNERAVVLTHKEVDALNGYVDPAPGESYLVNGYVDGNYAENSDIVDLAKDKTLRDRVAAANKLADDMIKSGELDLALPAKAAKRPGALERIGAAQRKLIEAIFDANKMSYGNPDSPAEFMVDGKRMVGRYLAAAEGKCTGQAMAVGAILREVGRRAGFDVRQIRANGHSFLTVMTGDARRYIMDPAGTALTNWEAPWLKLANTDYVTDRGPYASHYFNHLSFFADAGVVTTKFLSMGKRAIASAGGVARDFLDRLDAKAGLPAPPAKAKAKGSADDMIAAARRGGSAAIGGDLVDRGPRSPGMTSVLRGRVAERATAGADADER